MSIRDWFSVLCRVLLLVDIKYGHNRLIRLYHGAGEGGLDTLESDL